MGTEFFSACPRNFIELQANLERGSEGGSEGGREGGRSCSTYSRLLQVCVESLIRPEREKILLVLTLRFTARVGLDAPPAEAACRVHGRGRREPAPQLASTPQHEFSPVQARRMCLIARARTLTTKKTPWPLGDPRCSARARTSQSIEDRLHHDMCHAVSQPRLFRTPHCRTSPLAPDATGSLEASALTWNSRMLWRQFGEWTTYGNVRYLLRA